MTANYSPVFLRLRTIAFLCITLASFVWIVLLCCELFLRWTITDKAERSLIIAILIVNVITVIMAPVLVLLRFRPWLDGARFLFLLMAHVGLAVGFAYWSPRFTCPNSSSDQQGQCELITLYITIGNWINPALQIAYVLGLGLMVYRRSKRLRLEAEVVSPVKNLMDDEDSGRSDIESPSENSPTKRATSTISSPMEQLRSPMGRTAPVSIGVRPPSTRQSYYSTSTSAPDESSTAYPSMYSQASYPRYTTVEPPLPPLPVSRMSTNGKHLLHIQTDLPPPPRTSLPAQPKYQNLPPKSPHRPRQTPTSPSPRMSRSSSGSNGGYMSRVEANVWEVGRGLEDGNHSNKNVRLSKVPRTPYYHH